MFFTITFVILLHEFFHILIAKLLGFHTESVELFPFGGAAEIRGIEDKYVFEATVAAAGPFISLLTAFLWERGTDIGLLPLWRDFTSFSYNMAIINLLPVYPLDGGRILSCMLKGICGETRGRKISAIIAITISALFFINCLFGIIFFKKSEGIVMAAFMLIASMKSIKKPRRITFREKYWKNENIKIIKAYETEKIIDIFDKLSGNNFYCVLSVDSDENTMGIFTEKQLYDGILKNSSITLKELEYYPSI